MEPWRGHKSHKWLSRSRSAMAKSSAICDGLVRYGRSQPLFDHSFKLMGVSCYPCFSGFKQVSYEGVPGVCVSRKGVASEDMRVNFASQCRGKRTQLRGERPQSDIVSRKSDIGVEDSPKHALIRLRSP